MNSFIREICDRLDSLECIDRICGRLCSIKFIDKIKYSVGFAVLNPQTTFKRLAFLVLFTDII